MAVLEALPMMTVDREPFVLWLEPDSGFPEALRGSLEHPRSSLRVRFENTAELLAHFEQVLSSRPSLTEPTPGESE